MAGSPWTGASLSGPLGGRDAVFPHLGGAWGPDRALVAARLDGNGNTFSADSAYTAALGYGYTSPSNIGATGAGIANTTDDPMYRNFRYGLFGSLDYQFDLPTSGYYLVRLDVGRSNW